MCKSLPSCKKTLNHSSELLKRNEVFAFTRLAVYCFRRRAAQQGQLCVCECARRFHAPTTESKGGAKKRRGGTMRAQEKEANIRTGATGYNIKYFGICKRCPYDKQIYLDSYR